MRRDLSISGSNVVQYVFAGRRLAEDVVNELVAASPLALCHVEPAVDDAELFDRALEAIETD